MKKTLLLLLTISLALGSCKSSQYADLGDGIFANIQTTKGDMIVKLEYEKAPLTVANFVSLADGTNPFVSDSLKGKKYYDGLLFHRVMKDFMIQGGDPLGTGLGGPGYKFKNEINDSLKYDKKGILAMANYGPGGTNGSQFFITHKETPFLNGRYSIFGEVVKGLDVLDSIANVKTSKEPPTKDRPLVDVVMNKVQIIRNGKEAKKFDAVKVMTDYFAEEDAKEKAMEKVKADFVSETEKQKESVTKLPSGLLIYSIKKGSGEKPKIGQKVLVDYAGWLADGTLFDTTEKEVAKKFGKFDEISAMHRGNFAPYPMVYSPDAQLAAGFREGLLTMGVGDKVRLFIPSHLGYGPAGAGNVIPPNADLIFDLEITGISE